MNDTILNSVLIAAALSAIVLSAVGDLRAPQTAVAQASRVVEMEKTVVVAKRPAAEVMLIASASR